MLIKSRYSNLEMFLWTRFATLKFIGYAFVIGLFYEFLGYYFLRIPWAPLAVIGTAVAFIVGFRNNASYDRIWEARKIWGGIVNTSRTWGMKTRDMISNKHAKNVKTDLELTKIRKRLVYRHIAWMTALRHAMRTQKKWEDFGKDRSDRSWMHMLNIPEYKVSLEEELIGLIDEDERKYVLSKTNKATALLFQQSNDLHKLHEEGLVWEFSFLELENLLEELFTLQGKSERIKNFPYPRQFATLSSIFILIFIVLLPFAVLPEFHKIGTSLTTSFPIIGKYFVWIAVPFCAAISWVFYTMERIGKVGENPFEGSANDVPISTIARGIEIDLREMLDENEADIPNHYEQKLEVQM
jgi:putative membrane protein